MTRNYLPLRITIAFVFVKPKVQLTLKQSRQLTDWGFDLDREMAKIVESARAVNV